MAEGQTEPCPESCLESFEQFWNQKFICIVHGQETSRAFKGFLDVTTAFFAYSSKGGCGQVGLVIKHVPVVCSVGIHPLWQFMIDQTLHSCLHIYIYKIHIYI